MGSRRNKEETADVDRQEAFEKRVRIVIQWNKNAEGKHFIGSFMKELKRSAVEVTGGDYRLEFPQDFLLKHGERFTSTVTFERGENVSNQKWDIRLNYERSGNRIRVYARGEGGWREFVQENGFKLGDVLFFLLIGKSRFRVVPAIRPVE